MNTKALKQKILDLAIHGKLLPLEKVEKIRKEEPASVLLEKIRAEKQEKIAKGELKKDKNDSFIFLGDDKRHYEKFADGSVKDIEDEIPFEVPEGWSWTKIHCVSSEILYGVSESAKDSGKYKLLRITDIQDEQVNWDSVPFTDFPEEKATNYILKNGDIVFARTGATVGKSYLIENLTVESIYASYLIRIRTSMMLNPKYMKYYFGSLTYWNQITDKSSGIGQPNVNGTSLANLYIPLPTLAEQQLIVEEIEKIFAQIDLLEQNKTDLQTAIKQAKSKILDLAIHGKLVPQDPNDEPASVLLEKIRTEKEEKIAKGELKRDKNDSYIYKGSDNCHYQKNADGSIINIEEEIPFDVPESWCWCRLGKYLDIRDGTHDSPKYVESGYPFVTSKNLVDGKIDFSDIKYISEIDHNNFIQRSFVEDGDILFAMIGSIGNPVLVKKDREFSIKNVALFKPNNRQNTNMIYVYYYLSWLQDSLRKRTKGGMQPFIPLNLFRNELFIPLPPLTEQTRIVAKIEELFTLLDNIQNNLI